MKKNAPVRALFLVMMSCGGFLFILAVKKVSAENNSIIEKSSKEKVSTPFAISSTEFIFFESVTKYFIYSLSR